MTNFDQQNDEIYVFDDGELIFAIETTVSFTESTVSAIFEQLSEKYGLFWTSLLEVRMCVCVCVRACVRACVRVFVRWCVCSCVRASLRSCVYVIKRMVLVVGVPTSTQSTCSVKRFFVNKTNDCILII